LKTTACCLFTLTVLLAFANDGLASGYHPGFDRAVKEATWIVSHVVVSEHDAKDLLAGFPASGRPHVGRAYRVRVTRCFRGPFKANDEFTIWDPYARSTATYALNAKGPNLTFLMTPSASRNGDDWFGAKVTAKDGESLGLPIRNLSEGPSRGRGAGRKAWERLLDLTQAGKIKVPGDLARAALAETPGNPILIHYLLEHWDGWDAGDPNLVRQVLDLHKGRASTLTTALKLLGKHGERLGEPTLLRLLQGVAPGARNDLMEHVTAETIGSFEVLLGSWADKDEEGGAKAVALLGRFAPKGVERRLRARRLPFWLAIPAYKALGKRPADLGPEHAGDYDDTAMALASWELSQAKSVAHGNTFGLTYGFETQQAVWPKLLPLLVRDLRFLKPKVREVAIAMARSWGYEVTRKGESVDVGKRTTPPVDVSLSLVDGDHKVRVVVRALRAVTITKPSGRNVSVKGPKGGSSSSTQSGGDYGRPETPRDQFMEVAAGDVITDYVEDCSQLMEAVRQSEPKGPYRLRVAVYHVGAGVPHGLDAWTGMVLSKELELP
jgi:hypothetical protein